MQNKLTKTLRLFYVWTFLEALVFWYAIEKLLWTESGIDPRGVILLGLVAQAGQTLVEIPSSILADKWGRKKTLIAAEFFMLASIVIVLLVRNFLSFAMMSAAWACYFSFRSGTVQAYVFDHLKANGAQQLYRKTISRHGTFQTTASIIAAIIASFAAKYGSTITPYWMTLVPVFLAIIVLTKFSEPEQSDDSTVVEDMSHMRQVITGILKQRRLVFVFYAASAVSAAQFIWYEYYQLYAVLVETPAFFFGFLLATIQVGSLIGSEIAHRTKSAYGLLIILMGFAVTSSLVLAFSQGLLITFVGVTTIIACAQAATIVLDESVQHNISSKLRATTTSLIGFMSRIIFGIFAVSLVIYEPTPISLGLLGAFTFGCSFIFLLSKQHLQQTYND